MVYIYLSDEEARERSQFGQRKYAYWNCNLCGDEIRGGSIQIEDRLLDHLEEKHPNEINKMLEQTAKYRGEEIDFLKKLVEKYPLANNRGLTVFYTKLPNKPQKRWKCDCGEIMGTDGHTRDYHEANHCPLRNKMKNE